MTTYTNSIFKSRKKIIFYSFFIENFIQEAMFLINRLFIQTIRRPASIVSGLIQPLLWLVLFGALFQNVPLNLFNFDHQYNQFLSCGILIFTCFTGSLNAGLPLVFDREFGFLNRLLVTPLTSRITIIIAMILFTVCITMLQNFAILICSLQSFNDTLDLYKLQLITSVSFLITVTISSISLGLAFILPGHIEFLAFTFIINLPMLFASTALAPLYFMPYWLQIISKLNILTYAIETIRFITSTVNDYYNSSIIDLFGFNLNLYNIFTILILINLFSIIIVTHLINNKLE